VGLRLRLSVREQNISGITHPELRQIYVAIHSSEGTIYTVSPPKKRPPFVFFEQLCQKLTDFNNFGM